MRNFTTKGREQQGQRTKTRKKNKIIKKKAKKK